MFCLQEVTPSWAKRLDAALGSSHPHRAMEARYGAYGLAIFSRVPLTRPTVVKEGRRVAGQCVALALEAGETALCNVHLSSPAGVVERGTRWFSGFDANARVRARQWALLREHVARSYPQARHMIVAGDFNTLDTEPLYRTIRGSLVDAFAAAGDGYGGTFPTEPTSPVPLVRIDYVFASPALAPRAAEVLPQASSDHRGLRVTLAVPGIRSPVTLILSPAVARGRGGATSPPGPYRLRRRARSAVSALPFHSLPLSDATAPSSASGATSRKEWPRRSSTFAELHAGGERGDRLAHLRLVGAVLLAQGDEDPGALRAGLPRRLAAFARLGPRGRGRDRVHLRGARPALLARRARSLAASGRRSRSRSRPRLGPRSERPPRSRWCSSRAGLLPLLPLVLDALVLRLLQRPSSSRCGGA